MDKKYLAKIIATDNEGLQMISACCSGAKVKISDIKFLKSNKIFLLSVERTKVESGEEYKKVNSICKFDFVDRVKSKNIDQKNKDFLLELIGINYLKNKDDHEINLIKKACDISAEAHIAAMKAVKNIDSEQHIESLYIHEFSKRGARYPAYNPIVAGGENACVLHYVENNQNLAKSDLLLVDAGCEYEMYAHFCNQINLFLGFHENYYMSFCKNNF